MRRPLAAALFLAAAASAFAQQPPKLEPVPEPPPMPPMPADAEEQPAVTILKRGEDSVTEYRIRGKLYMIKVTPLHGVPYYLIDKVGNGQMVRDDTAPTLSVPMWVLQSW